MPWEDDFSAAVTALQDALSVWGDAKADRESKEGTRDSALANLTSAMDAVSAKNAEYNDLKAEYQAYITSTDPMPLAAQVALLAAGLLAKHDELHALWIEEDAAQAAAESANGDYNLAVDAETAAMAALQAAIQAVVDLSEQGTEKHE